MTNTDEHIDHTVWQAERSVISETRAAKGDLHIERYPPTQKQIARGQLGDIRFAQAQVKNLMNYMHERGILDHQHVHDGETFQLWQMVRRAESGYRHNSIYRGEIAGVRDYLDSEGINSADYARLIYALGPNGLTVEKALETMATPQEISVLRTPSYVRAFDALSRQMEALRSKRKENNDCESINYL